MRIAVHTTAGTEQLRRVEAVNIGEVILHGILGVGQLPTDEIVPFFHGNGKLLILGVGGNGQFAFQCTPVKIRGHCHGFVCLIQIPVFGYQRTVIERNPVPPTVASRGIPIHPLVKYEILKWIRCGVRR